MSDAPAPRVYPARERVVEIETARDFAAELNPQQAAAATHGDGPLLIIFGSKLRRKTDLLTCLNDALSDFISCTLSCTNRRNRQICNNPNVKVLVREVGSAGIEPATKGL